jgi:hypothetical protein
MADYGNGFDAGMRLIQARFEAEAARGQLPAPPVMPASEFSYRAPYAELDDWRRGARLTDLIIPRYGREPRRGRAIEDAAAARRTAARIAAENEAIAAEGRPATFITGEVIR